jgi:hypothetical protein
MKLGRRMPCGEWNEVTIQKYDISATRRAAAPTEGRAFLAMIILVILATLCTCDSNHDYPCRMGLLLSSSFTRTDITINFYMKERACRSIHS